MDYRNLFSHLGVSRRGFLWSGGSLTLLSACTRQAAFPQIAENLAEIDAIENRSGGRIGMAALDLASGRMIAHRGSERFAMCSSFKWLLGALILKEFAESTDGLKRKLTFEEDDLAPYSPVTEQHVGGEGMSLADLCRATIQTSDNTAANLLLAELGGPEGFTAMLRADGERVTRLDRWEPELNENAPGDPRDTTTPEAMCRLMGFYLFGDGLEMSGRDTLRSWMEGAKTGTNRLRAGIPWNWVSGDKTGTSSNNQSNDVAFAYRRDNAASIRPILIASYLNVPEPMSAENDAIHAEIARLSLEKLAL